MNCQIRVGTQEFATLSVDELPESPSAAQKKEKHNQKIDALAYYEQRKPQNVLRKEESQKNIDSVRQLFGSL